MISRVIEDTPPQLRRDQGISLGWGQEDLEFRDIEGGGVNRKDKSYGEQQTNKKRIQMSSHRGDLTRQSQLCQHQYQKPKIA